MICHLKNQEVLVQLAVLSICNILHLSLILPSFFQIKNICHPKNHTQSCEELDFECLVRIRKKKSDC